jgi:type I restriction enzyme S subunit
VSEMSAPNSWVLVPIEDCLVAYPNGKKIRQGWSPQCESYPAQTLDHWGVLKTTAIQEGSFIEHENKHLPTFLEPKTHLEVEAGDILITCAGPRARCGVTCLVRATRPKLLISGKMYQLRADSKIIDRRLLESFLREPRTRQRIDELKTGMSDSGLNLTHDRFKTLEVPLPPLAEQKRIADKLEAVLGRVDACRTRLDRVPDLLKRFRQSVLAAATSGQLTEDWREESPPSETGEILLNKVLKQRAECWSKKGRNGVCPEALLSTAELPNSPDGWAWIPLGHLGLNPFATVQTGPFGALLHTEEFTPHGVPVVAVGNLTGMGFTSDGIYFVSEEKAKQLSRFDVQAGDVLFARSGATLGKVCVAPSHANDWRMTGHILRARLNQKFLLPDLCVYALRADPFVTKQVFGSVIGSTRPGYNTSLLESIALPVPPLAEQAEIVRRVEALLAMADRIEARLSAARAQVERLTPATLAKAFRGDLVPQDSNDEPAAKLLERLNKDCSTAAQPRTKARKAKTTA